MATVAEPTLPRCEKCKKRADVHLVSRPGQIPGAAHASRWLCASCEYLEDHPGAARLARPRKPSVPQVETIGSDAAA